MGRSQRDILERAVRTLAEQAAKADALVDQALDAGLDGSHPLTVHAKMLRLELLQVKADLGRGAVSASDCSRCTPSRNGSEDTSSSVSVPREEPRHYFVFRRAPRVRHVSPRCPSETGTSQWVEPTSQPREYAQARQAAIHALSSLFHATRLNPGVQNLVCSGHSLSQCL